MQTWVVESDCQWSPPYSGVKQKQPAIVTCVCKRGWWSRTAKVGGGETAGEEEEGVALKKEDPSKNGGGKKLKRVGSN